MLLSPYLTISYFDKRNQIFFYPRSYTCGKLPFDMNKHHLMNFHLIKVVHLAYVIMHPCTSSRLQLSLQYGRISSSSNHNSSLESDKHHSSIIMLLQAHHPFKIFFIQEFLFSLFYSNLGTISYHFMSHLLFIQ